MNKTVCTQGDGDPEEARVHCVCLCILGQWGEYQDRFREVGILEPSFELQKGICWVDKGGPQGEGRGKVLQAKGIV